MDVASYISPKAIKGGGALCARFLALRSLGPVQKYKAPPSQNVITGVTCGLRLGRSVDSQYTSALAKSALASVPFGRRGPWLLNQPSRFVIGCLWATGSRSRWVSVPCLSR
jgi:hypothetical protein